jgi:hypothetical protein
MEDMIVNSYCLLVESRWRMHGMGPAAGSPMPVCCGREETWVGADLGSTRHMQRYDLPIPTSFPCPVTLNTRACMLVQ